MGQSENPVGIIGLTRDFKLSRQKWGFVNSTKKSPTINCRGFCDRDRIQTCNRLIRSQLLYSVELRDLFNYEL